MSTAVLELLCLRHGKTNYTEVFPDLTPEGITHVRKVAKDMVTPWVQKHQINPETLKICTSSAARAYGTAGYIASMIGYEGNFIPRCEIGPMERRDPIRAALVYEALRAGKQYVSYEREQAFQDPTIFETPREVRSRWYAFLAHYAKHALHTRPRHAILVSHYEVLSNLVLDLFGIEATQETELQHAEPIFLSVFPHDTDHRVMLSGSFRGKEAFAVFDLCDHSLQLCS